MTCSILGLGTAVPVQTISQGHAAELAKAFSCANPEQAKMLPTLYRRACVNTRGSVLLDEGTGPAPRQSFFPPATGERDYGPTTRQRMERYAHEAPLLALEAAKRALTDASRDASRVTDLITVSCTGFVAPGIDVSLINALSLPPTVGRTHIGFMGCHGALNGLGIATGLLARNPAATILLCAVELCSLHFRYGWNPEQLVGNALFADGAAALVLGAAPEAAADRWQLETTGSCLFPRSTDAMTWRIGDHGFEMTLSPRVPGLISEHLRPWLESWLSHQHLRLADIRSWAIHPGGPKILSAVAQCLSLPEVATVDSKEILASYGNMSSAALLFVLDRLRQRHAPRPCVGLGFGPGLVAEAVLFR